MIHQDNSVFSQKIPNSKHTFLVALTQKSRVEILIRELIHRLTLATVWHRDQGVEAQGQYQNRVQNECNKVRFISVWLQKAEINHSQKVKLACFPCLLYTWKQVHLAPYSIPVAALLSRQRQMVTDYHRLVWQMKNAFINSNHTNLFVSAETKRYTKLVARIPFSFCFPSVFCWCGHETSLITLFFCKKLNLWRQHIIQPKDTHSGLKPKMNTELKQLSMNQYIVTKLVHNHLSILVTILINNRLFK